jgi:DNA-binding NtrC family response regulator
MIKQVVVRQDEGIVNELIRSASQQPMPTAPSPTAAPSAAPNPVPANNDPHNYSLKDRVGKRVAEEEKRLIAEVLTKTNWNRRKAADMLEISYRSLLYKIKDYGLNATK